jgi:predicted protein tyrosine phosphatase
MGILVCPLSRVGELVAARAPARIVSLLDPEFETPATGDGYAGRHLRLSFHDIHLPAAGQILPAPVHVRELLGFLAAWGGTGTILVHCRAGIGRSTAAAFIAACLLRPDATEHDLALALRRASPLARPNETLIRIADAEMGRNGRMSEAIAATGRDLPWIDVYENMPFDLPLTISSVDLGST